MKKKELRKIYLTKRNSLTEREKEEKSQKIKEQLFNEFDLENIRYLHLFLSITEKGEIDTSSIINDLWRNYKNIKTFVPRVNVENNLLEHLEFNSESILKVSRWGIPEPIGDKFVVEEMFDLVLVPLLVFDEKGFRVGYGKGFYDKFLKLCREDCLKVGLSFFEPIEEIKDIHKFDVKLDYCVTPLKIWKF